mgnify:FL=1|jgi:hypothetical protein|tara:strand:+ start:26 stop:598 length:573 start_codon:yes stop_codon:yes gene_type:complete
MSTLETNLIQPSTGTTLTVGASGDTIDIPSGATFDVTGATVTGLSAGKILQVIQTNKSDMASSTSQTYADISGLSVNITPSSTSSKVLVSFFAQVSTNNHDAQIRLLRDSTEFVGSGASNDNGTVNARTYQGDLINTFGTMYLDSPNTTSQVTYKLQWRLNVAQTVYLNRRMGDTAFSTISNITVMEVGA